MQGNPIAYPGLEFFPQGLLPAASSRVRAYKASTSSIGANTSAFYNENLQIPLAAGQGLLIESWSLGMSPSSALLTLSGVSFSIQILGQNIPFMWVYCTQPTQNTLPAGNGYIGAGAFPPPIITFPDVQAYAQAVQATSGGGAPSGTPYTLLLSAGVSVANSDSSAHNNTLIASCMYRVIRGLTGVG